MRTFGDSRRRRYTPQTGRLRCATRALRGAEGVGPGLFSVTVLADTVHGAFRGALARARAERRQSMRTVSTNGLPR